MSKASTLSATAHKRPKKRLCFVIMPIGGRFDEYYSKIYSPAIEDAGLMAKRADEMTGPGSIIDDIWAYTQQAELVLADLTGKNPNVLYELGLAHASAKPAILISDSVDDIPFDLKSLRHIVYDKDSPDWGTTLRAQLTTNITEVLDMPRQAILPTFIKTKKSTAEASSYEKALLEVEQKLDLIYQEILASDTFKRKKMLSIMTGRLIPDPEEVKERIQSYIENGVPDDMIIDILSETGHQPSWIRQQIRRFRRVKD